MKNSSDTLPSDLTEMSPADDVARWIVGQRLKNVWRLLRMAGSKSVTGETVHRLRVSSREAQAALKICEPLLPKRRSRWMRRSLRHVRATAGAARELAVMRARLEKEMPIILQSELCDVLVELDRHRSNELRKMRKEYRRLRRRGFKPRARQLVARVRWRGDGEVPPWIVLARNRLSRAAEPFFAAAGQMDSIQDLHQIRLRAKRFRYALEVVDLEEASPETKRLHEGLKQVQDHLGVVNDHASDRRRVAKWMDHASSGGTSSSPIGRSLAVIAEHSQRGMARTEILFRQWWTDDRVAELERAWHDLYNA